MKLERNGDCSGTKGNVDLFQKRGSVVTECIYYIIMKFSNPMTCGYSIATGLHCERYIARPEKKIYLVFLFLMASIDCSSASLSIDFISYKICTGQSLAFVSSL